MMDHLPMRSMRFTLPMSAGFTRAACVRPRLRLVLFLVRMWLLNACLRLILPDPVTENRFFALELVFIFGMAQRCIEMKVYFFFGASMMFIFFPSRRGICSTFPKSASS